MINMKRLGIKNDSQKPLIYLDRFLNLKKSYEEMYLL